MKINFHDLASQYSLYKEEIQIAIQKVFNSCQFILGNEVFEFECALANFLNCKHVISCASGTDALQIAFMGIDIRSGDEIITSPFSFVSVAEITALLGATPVFADIHSETFNISPLEIEKKITQKTRAIVPVSLYGQPADMDEINKIAEHYSKKWKKKIYVIEDAAQSLGAEYKGKKSSVLSDIGCTSFFPSKPLGCYGDGGAVMVQDDELAKKIKSIRVHGQSTRYHHALLGTNARLDTIQAAILLVKLKYFNAEIKKRNEVVKTYDELLTSTELRLPKIKSDRTSVYSQYTIRSKHRDSIVRELINKNIPATIHYPKPLHLQKCFQYLGHQQGDFPVAEKMSQEVLSLPMSAFISRNQQEYIAEILNTIIEHIDEHEPLKECYE